jgi:CrcB protein
LLGVLTAWFAARGGDEAMRLLLGVGVLGGFTTFSAFSLDVVNMLERGAFGIAAIYVLASIVASIGALYLGRTLV